MGKHVKLLIIGIAMFILFNLMGNCLGYFFSASSGGGGSEGHRGLFRGGSGSGK